MKSWLSVYKLNPFCNYPNYIRKGTVLRVFFIYWESNRNANGNHPLINYNLPLNLFGNYLNYFRKGASVLVHERIIPS